MMVSRWLSYLVILLSIFIVGIIALATFGWKQSLLFVIGGLFGISLYHASFGFASSFRNFFIHREINGVLAQVLMLSVATVLFLPFLVKGSLFGQPIRGSDGTCCSSRCHRILPVWHWNAARQRLCLRNTLHHWRRQQHNAPDADHLWHRLLLG